MSAKDKREIAELRAQLEAARLAGVGAEVAALDRICASSKWMSSELSYGTTMREALVQGSKNRALRKGVRDER